MKRFIFALTLIAIMLSVHAHESLKVAYIKAQGNDVASFSIVDYSRVTFDKKNIVFDFADGQLLFPLTDYVSVSFSAPRAKARATSIEKFDKVAVSGIEIRLENGTIHIMNVREACDLKVHSLNGSLLYSKRIANETEDVLLSQFNERIMIIQVAGKILKVRL